MNTASLRTWIRIVSRTAYRLGSLICLAMSAFSAYLFYHNYWVWRHWFHEGRYFSAADSVVYTDDAFIYWIAALIFLALAVLLWRYKAPIKHESKKSNESILQQTSTSIDAPLYIRSRFWGLLLAPLGTPFAMLVMLFMFGNQKHALLNQPLSNSFAVVLASVSVIYVLSAPLVYAIGLPAMCWLRRSGCHHWMGICSTATLLGAAGYFGIYSRLASGNMTDISPQHFVNTLLLPCATGAACGLSIGIIYCAVIGLQFRVRVRG
jgi:hypothetical protein